MKRTVTAVSVLALAGLAGCGSDPVQPAPTPIVITPPPAQVVTTPAPAATTPAPTTVVVQSPAPVRVGFGRVESISASPSASAAAGGATMRRLGIKMEDGTMQTVDTPAGNIAIGDRVELTADGKIRH